MALKDSRIIVDTEVMCRLEAWSATLRTEFSGFGVVEQRGNDFYIPRIYLMAVGSEGYTEISGEKIIEMRMAERELPQPGLIKLWFHKHPVNGWSGTDEKTCREEPLASTPEAVKWALAIVRTPSGWLGRLDTFEVPATYTLPVLPDFTRADEELIQGFRSEWNKRWEVEMRDFPTLSHVGNYQQSSLFDGIYGSMFEGLDDYGDPYAVEGISDIEPPVSETVYDKFVETYGMYGDAEDWFMEWYEYGAKDYSWDDLERFTKEKIEELKREAKKRRHGRHSDG